MFVSFSNHPVERWGKEQKQAAQDFGEIRDFPFPDVPAVTTTEEIIRMAEKCSKEIILLNPDCVMCQGEFTLTVSVVRRLQEAGIRCVCACSERKTLEEQLPGGVTKKTSVFAFCQFREYERSEYEEEKYE